MTGLREARELCVTVTVTSHGCALQSTVGPIAASSCQGYCSRLTVQKHLSPASWKRHRCCSSPPQSSMGGGTPVTARHHRRGERPLRAKGLRQCGIPPTPLRSSRRERAERKTDHGMFQHWHGPPRPPSTPRFLYPFLSRAGARARAGAAGRHVPPGDDLQRLAAPIPARSTSRVADSHA